MGEMYDETGAVGLEDSGGYADDDDFAPGYGEPGGVDYGALADPELDALADAYVDPDEADALNAFLHERDQRLLSGLADALGELLGPLAAERQERIVADGTQQANAILREAGVAEGGLADAFEYASQLTQKAFAEGLIPRWADEYGVSEAEAADGIAKQLLFVAAEHFVDRPKGYDAVVRKHAGPDERRKTFKRPTRVPKSERKSYDAIVSWYHKQGQQSKGRKARAK